MNRTWKFFLTALVFGAVLNACEDDAMEPEGPMDVAIDFAAQVNGAAFACGTSYDNVGASSTTINIVDFRLYVHDVRLVSSSGAEVPVELEQDGQWQLDDLALLELGVEAVVAHHLLTAREVGQLESGLALARLADVEQEGVGDALEVEVDAGELIERERLAPVLEHLAGRRADLELDVGPRRQLGDLGTWVLGEGNRSILVGDRPRAHGRVDRVYAIAAAVSFGSGAVGGGLGVPTRSGRRRAIR